MRRGMRLIVSGFARGIIIDGTLIVGGMMMGYVRHEHVMRTCMHASLLFVTLTLAIPTTGSAAAVADVCTLAPSISRKCVNLDI